MSDFNWSCPHCQHDVTITDQRFSSDRHTLRIDNSVGRRTLVSTYVVCPNQNCRRFTLSVRLFESYERTNTHRDHLGTEVAVWQLIPASTSKPFPEYVPKAIRDDYGEACLIKDLSPKASATLSRRCLQGILRDFWRVKPGRLVDEIAQIQERIDPITWSAIEAVRKIGNIGAHMEKDIDTIIEVDPNEASLLIGLVETLIEEWYVARAERAARMEAVIAAATKKETP